MANAQVEKLKDLSLRHGEKVVVGLVSLICLFFLYLAATKKSIELTPEQVSKDAQAAQSNLSKPQPATDILTRIEEQGIKNPGLVAMVETQEKDLLKPGDFPVVRTWVTPEPGAGLIRDMPELIAATELFAYPGRGGALVFALDDDKKRVPEDPAEKKVDVDALSRRRKKRGRGAPASSGSPALASADPSQMTEAQKKARDLEKKKREALFTPGAEKAEEKTEEAPTAAAEAGPFKEVTQGLRWVAITGVVDHKKLRDNYTAALKNPAIQPNYKQLNVERQVKQPNGDWSDWEAVDSDKNHEILYNLPEEEEELTPEAVRIAALVDPLPFLKAGYWERVHVASLVPKEQREVDVAATPGGLMMGREAAPLMLGPASSGPSMPAGDFGMGMGMGGGMGSPTSGAVENTNYAKTDAETIMIRSLDFTVEPDTTYRFRVQIEVFNPNYNHEDVNPGVNTKDLVLKGPWSEPTNEVTMPADVTAYAMRKTPTPNAKRPDTVSFQVVKWNPENGVTTYRNMEYSLGQIVGEIRTTPIPSSDGTAAKSLPVDYNSHQVLIDETGGEQPLTSIGIGGRLDVPALSLLLRPDGSVMVRNQAYDVADTVRKDIKQNYDREIEESGKKRESSNGFNGPSSGMR